jgi:hypothetical protein
MTSPETQAQREAMLQREAFEAGAMTWYNTQGIHVEEMRRRFAQSALRRYPDPLVVEPRVEAWPLNVRSRIEKFRDDEWVSAWLTFEATSEWLDFANDLRAWPLRVVGSGRVCRQGTDGKLEFRDEETK